MSQKPVRAITPGYLLYEAARDGVLLKVVCRVCWRRAVFRPDDLARIYGPMELVHQLPFPCSHCKTAEYMNVARYYPQPGDYGALIIRRPGQVKTIQTWRNIKLGDE